MKRTTAAGRNRAGFSLIELVVVVLIMGILAAVAAPRMFDKMDAAREASTRQSLAVIRTALEQYKLEDTGNKYPGDADNLPSDLSDFLRGEFPKCEVAGAVADIVASTDDPLKPTGTDKGWVYNETTGEFRVNSATYITW